MHVFDEKKLFFQFPYFSVLPGLIPHSSLLAELCSWVLKVDHEGAKSQKNLMSNKNATCHLPSTFSLLSAESPRPKSRCDKNSCRGTFRPNPHRTRDAMLNAMQGNGTCWCEWGCPHCTQATSKEKCSNLRLCRFPRPVWIGPHSGLVKKLLSDTFVKVFSPLFTGLRSWTARWTLCARARRRRRGLWTWSELSSQPSRTTCATSPPTPTHARYSI